MTENMCFNSRFLSRPEEVGVVAVGFSGGQGKAGVASGPSVILSTGLLDQIRNQLGYKVFYDGVHTYEDFVPQIDPEYRGMKNPRTVSIVNRQLSEQVNQHAKVGRFVLTLGGDHSIAIGTISGTAKAIHERTKKKMAVVWVDAHGDINTPEASESGNIHGMPVAFLTGVAEEKREDIFGWLNAENMIDPNYLVYIGLRDLDRKEKEILKKHKIKAFTMHDIDRHGIGKVMDMTLAYLGDDLPIHLSFDVDALDPTWAPSTGTPVRGGLTIREGNFITEYLFATKNLIAMDLVEVNPKISYDIVDGNDDAAAARQTLASACSLIKCALGESLL